MKIILTVPARNAKVRFFHHAEDCPAMSQNNSITFALAFKSGLVLFTERAGTYFLPADTMEAFQIYGEHKELFGKKAVSVRSDRTSGAPAYSLVYEFNDAQQLTDARLISGNTALPGTLLAQDALDSYRGALAQGALTLYNTQDTAPVMLSRVARFVDGRYLILVANDAHDMYIGTPGNYEKVDAQLYVQGGNSLYFKTPQGEKIDLPYGFGEPRFGEPPIYKGEELSYVRMQQNGNPAEFGLALSTGRPHLSPFHPLLEQPASPPTAPKPPQP